MKDFGLRDACNSHPVVFLDTCVLELSDTDMFSARSGTQPVPSVRSERDHVNYLREIRRLFGESLFVTPAVAGELEIRVEAITRKKSVPRHRINLVREACEAARRKTISYTEEEKMRIEDASLYFKTFEKLMSGPDYEILMSAIATATHRGSTGILTNDSAIVNAFESMTRYLRRGYIFHGYPPVPNPICVYSIMLDERFSRQAFYDPHD